MAIEKNKSGSKNTKTSSKEKENNQKSSKEEIKASGDQLVKKIRKLIKEGNVRRIIIKNEKKEVLMEIPVTFAVLGTVIAPILAAVGALAALITNCTIEVERK